MKRREQLNQLDDQIQTLVEKRRAVASALIDEKVQQGQPVYDARREAEIEEETPEALPYVREERLLHETQTTRPPALPLLSGTHVRAVAGPCSIESKQTAFTTANDLALSGVQYVRGGCWKPRTKAASWQGHGGLAATWLVGACKPLGLQTVVEVVDDHSLYQAIECGVDVFQIGARNAQNFELLKKCNDRKVPVLLKRGPGMTVEEWLGAASYLEDCPVTLCERGVKSFEPSTRNMLDLAGATLAAMQSGYQVIVDLSHATGNPKLVTALAPAVAAIPQLAGVMVEWHPNIAQARTDVDQALDGVQLMSVLRSMAPTTV